MKNIAILLIVFFSEGCSRSYFAGYIPVEEKRIIKTQFSIEWSFLPSYAYYYSEDLSEDSHIFVEVIGIKNTTISINVVLDFNSKFQFLNDELRVTNLGSEKVSSVPLGLFISPKNSAKKSPKSELFGEGLDIKSGENTYVMHVPLDKVILSDCIEIQLPKIKIDGTIKSLAPINLRKFSEKEKLLTVCN